MDGITALKSERSVQNGTFYTHSTFPQNQDTWGGFANSGDALITWRQQGVLHLE